MKNVREVPSAGKHTAGTKLDFLKVFSKSVYVRVDSVARLATSSLTLLAHKKTTCDKSSTKRARGVKYMSTIQMILSLYFQTYFISKKSPKVQRADGGRADDDEVNRSSRSWNNKQETIILYERNTTVIQK